MRIEKEQLISSLKREFKHWETWLQTLSNSQLSSPLAPSALSIKDNLAHLHFWQQISIARLAAALSGFEPEFDGWPRHLDPDNESDLESINSWIFENCRDLTWDQVFTEWQKGFTQFIKLAEKVAEEDLFIVEKFDWMYAYSLADVLTGSMAHHQEHFIYLRGWFLENTNREIK